MCVSQNEAVCHLIVLFLTIDITYLCNVQSIVITVKISNRANQPSFVLVCVRMCFNI